MCVNAELIFLLVALSLKGMNIYFFFLTLKRGSWGAVEGFGVKGLLHPLASQFPVVSMVRIQEGRIIELKFLIVKYKQTYTTYRKTYRVQTPRQSGF